MHCGPRVLTFISLTLGGVAVVTLALSVSTDAWLFTKESYPEADVNASTVTTIVRSGLWRVCKLEHKDGEYFQNFL